MIHAYAGAWSHYTNHLYPIWKALPDDIRGDFYVRRDTSSQTRASELSIPWKKFRNFDAHETVLVASYEDYRAVKPAKVVFLNHGVGQTYSSARGMSSYSGGPDRDRTILFLGPSYRDAHLNRTTYPDIPSEAIGVPYLDQFYHSRRPGPVVISFHGDVRTCDESRWAWPHFRQGIENMIRRGYSDIVGHSHPRARIHLEPWWKKLGIRFEPDWWKCLEIASCYVIDNSSSGYEAAALGIPTVWMNAPWYRKDVHHGLRFWDAIPGIEVDDPEHLEQAIKIALHQPFTLRQKADVAISVAYGDADGRSLVDGHATRRAVDALCRLTRGWSTSPTTSSPTSVTD